MSSWRRSFPRDWHPASESRQKPKWYVEVCGHISDGLLQHWWIRGATHIVVFSRIRFLDIILLTLFCISRYRCSWRAMSLCRWHTTPYWAFIVQLIFTFSRLDSCSTSLHDGRLNQLKVFYFYYYVINYGLRNAWIAFHRFCIWSTILPRTRCGFSCSLTFIV